MLNMIVSILLRVHYLVCHADVFSSLLNWAYNPLYKTWIKWLCCKSPYFSLLQLHTRKHQLTAVPRIHWRTGGYCGTTER